MFLPTVPLMKSKVGPMEFHYSACIMNFINFVISFNLLFNFTAHGEESVIGACLPLAPLGTLNLEV